MRACICTCAYTHIHIYTHIDTWDAHTHARAQTLPAPIRNRNCFFDANLEKMPGRIENGRRGPKAASSNFEHKPLKPENGLKVTTVLHF